MSSRGEDVYMFHICVVGGTYNFLIKVKDSMVEILKFTRC